MRKVLIIIGAVIIALLAFRWGMGMFGQMMRAKMMSSMMIPKVKVGTITTAEVTDTMELPGRVAAKYTTDLVARIDGFLQKKYFNEGDFVKQGQVMFLIEPTRYVNEVNRATADLKNAQANLVNATKNFERMKELVAQDYISKATYDQALASKDMAAATVQSARAVLSEAQRNLSYTRVTSPITGRVGMVNITEGNYVNTSVGKLATVVSMDPIYVTYGVDSKKFTEFLGKDNKNNDYRVELFLQTGEKYSPEGKADFYNNVIDPSMGTISLRATYSNPENKLIPGDFVTVKLYSSQPVKRVVVPMTAVLQNPQGRYVYMLDENGNAKSASIEVGSQQGTDWIVEKGLNEGDEIITEGLGSVLPGRPVKVLSPEEQLPETETNESKAGTKK